MSRLCVGFSHQPHFALCSGLWRYQASRIRSTVATVLVSQSWVPCRPSERCRLIHHCSNINLFQHNHQQDVQRSIIKEKHVGVSSSSWFAIKQIISSCVDRMQSILATSTPVVDSPTKYQIQAELSEQDYRQVASFLHYHIQQHIQPYWSKTYHVNSHLMSDDEHTRLLLLHHTHLTSIQPSTLYGSGMGLYVQGYLPSQHMVCLYPGFIREQKEHFALVIQSLFHHNLTHTATPTIITTTTTTTTTTNTAPPSSSSSSSCGICSFLGSVDQIEIEELTDKVSQCMSFFVQQYQSLPFPFSINHHARRFKDTTYIDSHVLDAGMQYELSEAEQVMADKHIDTAIHTLPSFVPLQFSSSHGYFFGHRINHPSPPSHHARETSTSFPTPNVRFVKTYLHVEMLWRVYQRSYLVDHHGSDQQHTLAALPAQPTSTRESNDGVSDYPPVDNPHFWLFLRALPYRDDSIKSQSFLHSSHHTTSTPSINTKAALDLNMSEEEQKYLSDLFVNRFPVLPIIYLASIRAISNEELFVNYQYIEDDTWKLPSWYKPIPS